MSIIGVAKLIGAALVVTGGIAAAYILNSRAKRMLGVTEGMILLLRYIKTQVGCYSMPIEKILSGYDNELFSECGYAGEEKPKSLDALILGCPALEGRALQIMTEFSRSFGKNYRAEQVKLCESSIDELAGLRAELSEKLPMRRKLNSTLCLSGAMAIVILLV